jgi:hypothetical protein
MMLEPFRAKAAAIVVGRSFWIELVMAGLTGFLFVLTLVWHDWMEAVGMNSDHGSGAAEWTIVGVLLVLTGAFSLAARVAWRRAANTGLA